MAYIGTKDFALEVARGNVAGVSQFSKFGYNGDIDIGTETIWAYGGTWTPQTTARTLSVVSSSTDDDGSPAGTGARTVTIIGVDASRNSQTETITMDGTTPVVTSGTWLGVNRMVVATAGSSKTNVGNITATSTTDSLVQGYIVAGESITNQMIYFVPATQTTYVTRLVLSTDKLSAGVSPLVGIKGYVVTSAGVKTQVVYDFLDTSGQPHLDSHLDNPFVVAAGSYFYLEATTDTNNTFVRARVEMTNITN